MDVAEEECLDFEEYFSEDEETVKNYYKNDNDDEGDEYVCEEDFANENASRSVMTMACLYNFYKNSSIDTLSKAFKNKGVDM
jgi:hypothetical protein